MKSLKYLEKLTKHKKKSQQIGSLNSYRKICILKEHHDPEICQLVENIKDHLLKEIEINNDALRFFLYQRSRNNAMENTNLIQIITSLLHLNTIFVKMGSL